MARKQKGPRKFRGLPVRDADEDFTLSVSRADVAKADKNRKDPNNCAAARAIQRTVQCPEAVVFSSRTYVKTKDGKQWVRFLTPESVSREIVAFDRGSSFEPGVYKFKAPSPACRLGNYRGVSTRNGKGRKQSRHVTENIRDWKVST